VLHPGRRRGGRLRREVGPRRRPAVVRGRRQPFFAFARVAVVVVVVVVVVRHRRDDRGRRAVRGRRALLGPVPLVVMVVVVMVVVVTVPFVSAAAAGHRGQQAPVAPDPCPVRPGHRAVRAHVHANRAQWFGRGPNGDCRVAVAFCKTTS